MAKKKETLASPFVPAEEQPYPIPENWCWIHLLDSFENHTDSKKKVQSKTYLENGELAVVDQGQELIGGYTDDENMTYSGKLPVIVFGDHTRCIKYIDFPFAQGADGVKVLLPKSFYDVRAFYFALQSIDIPNMGYRRHYPLFPQFCIPVPPLHEQHRIVTCIESLFAKLDEAKEKAQAVVDGVELRKSAILHKAFTGELTERWRKEHDKSDSDWRSVRFDEAAEIMSNLVDPAGYQDFPHIAPDNIEKRTGVLLEYHTIAEDGVKSGKHLFHAGQILYSKIRPNLSKIVMVDFDGLCSADMYPVNAKEDTRYLWYYMLSDEFLEQASNAGSRSVLPKINQKELSKVMVRMTSLEEQQAIVIILDNIFEKEKQAKEAAEAVLAQIDTMKKAILARAFRGELGTNDPNEESSAKLVSDIESRRDTWGKS